MKEMRQFKRVEKQFLASYEVISRDQQIQDSGMALEVDLSLNGLNLEIPAEPRIGETIKIILAIKEKMITLIGEVVWIKPGKNLNNIGCQLTKIEKKYKEILKSWLSKDENDTAV